MARPLRPLMSATSTEPSDLEGRVLWWTILSEIDHMTVDLQIEAVHTHPYGMRLTVFDLSRAGSVIANLTMHLPGDGKLPPTDIFVQRWRALVCDIVRDLAVAS